MSVLADDVEALRIHLRLRRPGVPEDVILAVTVVRAERDFIGSADPDRVVEAVDGQRLDLPLDDEVKSCGVV